MHDAPFRLVAFRLVALALVLIVWTGGGDAAAQTESSFGSRLSFGIGVEMQAHVMGDLEDQLAFQTEQRGNDLEVPTEVVSSYPVRPAVNAVLYLPPQPRLRYGFTVGFVSTGGRGHYADYSGSVSVSHVTERWSIGTVTEYRFAGTNASTWSFWGTMQSRLGFTTVALDSEVRVVEQTVDSGSLELTSRGIDVRPGLAVEYDAGLASVRAFVGGELFLFGTLQFEGQDVQFDGESARTNWTGGHTGVSVIVEIP